MDEDAIEEIYEADCIVGVKWGRHKHGVEKGKKPEHIFKTRWKGCGESEDTWEPLTNLEGCKISENSLSFLILPDNAQAHALKIFSTDSCVRIFLLLSIQRSVSQAKAKAKEYDSQKKRKHQVCCMMHGDLGIPCVCLRPRDDC